MLTTYALRECSRALLAGPRSALASCSQGAAGGGRWLLMAVRGHRGGTRLRLIVTAMGTELDPVHEACARFFEDDRSSWKGRLRSAWFTDTCGRRSFPPLRKVIENPVQSGQAAPGWMAAWARHISIMRLLSLGYEPHDVRLPRLIWSPAAVPTSVDGCGASTPHLGVSKRRVPSRRVSCTNPCTNLVADQGASQSPYLRPLPCQVSLASGLTCQTRSRCLRCCPRVAVIPVSRPLHRARGGRELLRPELAAPLGVCPLSQLTQGVGGGSCLLLSGGVAVPCRCIGLPPVSLNHPARCAVWTRRPSVFRWSGLLVLVVRSKRGRMLSCVRGGGWLAPLLSLLLSPSA
jgi:hypothetical protein